MHFQIHKKTTHGFLPSPPSSIEHGSFPFSIWKKALLVAFVVYVYVSLIPPIYLDYFRNAPRFVAPDGTKISAGMDFDARYNEIACVMDGIDPYAIRIHPELSNKYAHYLAPRTHPPKRRIDAYTPWSYTFFGWLLFFPEHIAWTVFYLGMLACLCCLPFFACIFAETSGKWMLAACTAASLFLGFPVTACLYAGNYGLFIAANLCLFIWAMQCGHRFWASVSFALMMIKPQVVALLIIPLVLKREFGVCALATILCVVAAIPPAICCHQSLLSIILEIFAFGSTVATQTKLFPSSVMALLSPVLPLAVVNIVSAALGATLCLWLSMRLKHSSSWLIRCLPAIVLGSFWTYCLPYNDCTLCVPQLLFCWILLNPFPAGLKWPAAFCFGFIPLLHIHRTVSMDNLPWSLGKVLGFSFPDHSLPVRMLAVVHLLAGYLFLAAFILFCLRLTRSSFSSSPDSLPAA